QLTDVDKKLKQGQELLTQFYTQRQYAQSADVIGIVDDSIAQTRKDNEDLDQLRLYLIGKLGKNVPTTGTNLVPVNESAPVVTAQIDDFTNSGLTNVVNGGF
ncbi:MAG: hypothetical protein H7123_04440, partial [Thermoleophilia bacterium]|nr:hypothetical protein [Thermoleophilia bacterium]